MLQGVNGSAVSEAVNTQGAVATTQDLRLAATVSGTFEWIGKRRSHEPFRVGQLRSIAER